MSLLSLKILSTICRILRVWVDTMATLVINAMLLILLGLMGVVLSFQYLEQSGKYKRKKKRVKNEK